VNNFALRTITGALFVILIVGSVIVNHWIFAALFMIVALGGYWEYTRLSRAMGAYQSVFAGLLVSALTYALISCWNFGVLSDNSLYFLLLIPVILVSAELSRKSSTALTNVGMSLFGIIWIVVPLALLSGFFNLAEEHKWRETGLLLGFFLILWIYDSGAYIFGSLFGKHRMLERISPKKSWEGFAGGTLAGLLIAFIISASFTEFTLTEWLLIGVSIVIFGTIGDLTESMFKRNAGVKDSGKILPGHGGILDRFDAVFIAAPVVYILIRLLRLLN
jgi:phosphatidate cytidylyltransferase